MHFIESANIYSRAKFMYLTQRSGRLESEFSFFDKTIICILVKPVFGYVFSPVISVKFF